MRNKTHLLLFDGELGLCSKKAQTIILNKFNIYLYVELQQHIHAHLLSMLKKITAFLEYQDVLLSGCTLFPQAHNILSDT